MVGSTARNFHEGHRSEYLAQFVFASFGTAIVVPQQEDSGLDLLCTLDERIGQRSWPRFHFAVQVKSTLDSWIFCGEESVRWFIKYPLPILFCVVDKSEARLRIYHTQPRYYVWSLPPLPNRIELTPSTEHEGRCVQWEGEWKFNLSAPILDFTISDLLGGSLVPSPEDILAYWLRFDLENLRRIQNGVLQFRMPFDYRTNSANSGKIGGWMDQGVSSAATEAIEQCKLGLMDQLSWISTQLFRSNDIKGAARAAILHRYLFPCPNRPQTHPDDLLQTTLNRLIQNDASNFHFRGVDTLARLLDAELDKICVDE